MKNSASGPSSSANLTIGLSAFGRGAGTSAMGMSPRIEPRTCNRDQCAEAARLSVMAGLVPAIHVDVPDRSTGKMGADGSVVAGDRARGKGVDGLVKRGHDVERP